MLYASTKGFGGELMELSISNVIPVPTPNSTVRKCNLKKHQKTHSDGSFSCDQCPYKAHTMSQLEQHICTHSGEKIFACDKCPFRATQRFILKHHVALKHSGTAEESCTKAVGETFDIKN